MENEAGNRLDAADANVIKALGHSISGTSAEDLGNELGLDKMLLFYQLDKLVKLGLLKRSRPMFLRPELYELTETGRERMAA